eukprot:1250853-Pleurochrysis_carterae.AAC.2
MELIYFIDRRLQKLNFSLAPQPRAVSTWHASKSLSLHERYIAHLLERIHRGTQTPSGIRILRRI